MARMCKRALAKLSLIKKLSFERAFLPIFYSNNDVTPKSL